MALALSPRATIAHVEAELALRSLAGDNIPQRTPAWYARRGVTSGASTAGTRVPAGSVGRPLGSVVPRLAAGIAERGRKMVEARASVARRARTGDTEAPFGFPACWWGTAVEPLSDQVAALCGRGAAGGGTGAVAWPVVCGSLVGCSVGASRTACSPDGVGSVPWRFWVRRAAARGTNDAGDDPATAAVERAVLLEFKNPSGRSAAHSAGQWGYAAQVLAGMDALPQLDRALLLATSWRRAPGVLLADPGVYAAVRPDDYGIHDDADEADHAPMWLGADAPPGEPRRKRRRPEPAADPEWCAHARRVFPHYADLDISEIAELAPPLMRAPGPAYAWTVIGFERVPGALVHPLAEASMPRQRPEQLFPNAPPEGGTVTVQDRKDATATLLRELRANAAAYPFALPAALAGARGPRLEAWERRGAARKLVDLGGAPERTVMLALWLEAHGVLRLRYLPVRWSARGAAELAPAPLPAGWAVPDGSAMPAGHPATAEERAAAAAAWGSADGLSAADADIESQRIVAALPLKLIDVVARTFRAGRVPGAPGPPLPVGGFVARGAPFAAGALAYANALEAGDAEGARAAGLAAARATADAIVAAGLAT